MIGKQRASQNSRAVWPHQTLAMRAETRRMDDTRARQTQPILALACGSGRRDAAAEKTWLRITERHGAEYRNDKGPGMIRGLLLCRDERLLQRSVDRRELGAQAG